MKRYNKKDYRYLRKEIRELISTVCFWENVYELKNFSIAISPHLDAYCSRSNNEWYEEYTPGDDWEVFQVADEREAMLIPDYYFGLKEK